MTGRHQDYLIELLKTRLIQNGFNTVPTDIAFVELDRLVVYQKHIDLTHVAELKQKLGPTPTEEQVFRTCLPHDMSHPPVKWARKGKDSYVFLSPSNDLRYLGTMQLKPEHITGYSLSGNPVSERTSELAVKIDELRLANEELESRTKQLRLLAAELTLTKERERKRLSQLLHDGLQQHLLSAKMRLGGVAELIGDVNLKQATNDIEKIIGESVQLSRSLSPRR